MKEDTGERTLARVAAHARSLGRLAKILRAFSLFVIFIAGICFLYGLSRIDHRVDDFVGFSCIALAMTVFALLFWSVALFHAAFADFAAWAIARDERPARAPRRAPIEPRPLASDAAGELTEAIASAADAAAAEVVPVQTSVALAVAVPPPVPPTTKMCARCGGEIRYEATRCRFCMSVVA